ncbi:hypothetical protein CI109_101739 [Kwoniella shandongensis]|uniref:Uncharacterized protein n=1 Tax=Kwoniella shandongensis TaxID=1734106 RepID=A0A5M6C5B3_9TREE|nr:uncharacterized protein CI109_001138 [Kwoniella shandongensis]KAA5530337.1 hypothetical protein CI109_001138 [Kwoniella shandongensis]
MSYPYPPYQQASAPAPYYPPVPAQPPVDPFRAYYADRLRQLTFNSRPLIQDLSMTAMAQRDQNNWSGMGVVVEEIEAAVLRAPPTQKLPLLYLIDSISKNIGQPYTTHLLPPIIPRLYLKTYREVDGVTKAKMEEMIGLWRTSGPGGVDLYGPQVREQIEREIFGSMGYQRQPRQAVPPTRQQVLATLHSTLEAKHRESAARPLDPKLSQQVNALVGIGELLNTTNVSPQDLSQIMEQLRAMSAPVPSQPVFSPVPPPVATPTWGGTAPVTANLPPFPPSIHNNNAGLAPRPPFAPTLPASSSTPIPGSRTPIPAPNPVAITTGPIPGLPVDVAKILQSLNKSGLGSQPRTPEPQPPSLPAKGGLDAYEDMIINMGITLQTIDLNAPRVLSFDHLPHRCKQCGMRFPAADAKFDAHMDWHFRRNRKERETAGRGAHRRWLPRAEEWIKDVVEAGPSTLASPSHQVTASTQVSAERLAQLRQKWVKVPQDTKKAAAVCPVCKEAFKGEWSEDEEEWIWKNALNINGTIYHATCRAEQTSAMRRLKGADGNRRSASGSPRLTPQPETTATSTAAAASKRKAEEGESVKQEDGEVKRVKVEDAEVTMVAEGASAADGQAEDVLRSETEAQEGLTVANGEGEEHRSGVAEVVVMSELAEDDESKETKEVQADTDEELYPETEAAE